VQALVVALGGFGVFLQELAVGIDLDGQQEGHFKDRLALAEVLADALLFGERIVRRSGHDDAVASLLSAARVAAGGNVKLPVGSRWYCRHQHAFSRYFRLSTRIGVALTPAVPGERPKAGSFRPQPSVVA